MAPRCHRQRSGPVFQQAGPELPGVEGAEHDTPAPDTRDGPGVDLAGSRLVQHPQPRGEPNRDRDSGEAHGHRKDESDEVGHETIGAERSDDSRRCRQ